MAGCICDTSFMLFCEFQALFNNNNNDNIIIIVIITITIIIIIIITITILIIIIIIIIIIVVVLLLLLLLLLTLLLILSCSIDLCRPDCRWKLSVGSQHRWTVIITVYNVYRVKYAIFNRLLIAVDSHWLLNSSLPLSYSRTERERERERERAYFMTAP